MIICSPASIARDTGLCVRKGRHSGGAVTGHTLILQRQRQAAVRAGPKTPAGTAQPAAHARASRRRSQESKENNRTNGMSSQVEAAVDRLQALGAFDKSAVDAAELSGQEIARAVSYTHLTLPTKA